MTAKPGPSSGDGAVAPAAAPSPGTSRDVAELLSLLSADLILRHIHDAVVVTDADTVVRFWNEGATRLFGWQADEMLGRSIVLRYPEAKQPEIRRNILQMLDGHAWDGEYLDLRKDGRQVWIDARVRRICNAAGRPLGLLGISNDITERKLLAGEVHRLQTLSTDLICTAMPDGRLVRVNSAFRVVLGWTESDLLGRPLCAIIHPDEAEAARRVLAGFAGLTPGGPADYECRLLHRDGSYRWIQWRAGPVDGTGTVCMAGRDVTERRRELQLMALVEDDARVGGWELDFATRQIRWTRQMFLLFGLPPDGPVPSLEESLSYFAPEVRQTMAVALADAMANGSSWEGDLPLITAQGKRIWVHTRATTSFDGGRPVRSYGSMMDITGRKVAEEAAREREEQFRTLAEHLPDPLFVLDPDDPDVPARILYCNPAVERTHGWKPSELVGRSIFEALDTQEMAGRRDALAAEVESGRPVTFEGSHRRRDGSIIRLEIRAVLIPWRGRRAVLGIDRDLTDIRRVEERLRLLGTCVSQLDDAVIVAEVSPDRRGPPRIVFVNEAFERIFGRSRAEVLGRSPDFLEGPQTDPEEAARLKAAHRDGIAFRGEMVGHTSSGEPRWMDVNMVPVTGEGGRLTHWVSVERDVTERRRLEEQFRQAQKMEVVGQLAGGIAHDFNNLLTVINGCSELILEDLPADHPQRELAAAIRDAGRRAATLTAQLLAFGRRSIAEPRILDLPAAVGAAAGMLRRLIGEDIALSVECAAPQATVRMDPGLLDQVLINLAVNARDAMPAGGTLRIAITRTPASPAAAPTTGDGMTPESRGGGPSRGGPAGGVILAVTDTGTGMTPEVRARVFEPFFTTKPKGKGTGLGLATVYGIVRQAGGDIRLDSTVGRGTTVTITLPAALLPEDSAAPADGPARRGRSATVLLAEDEDEVRRLAQRTLEREGCRVLAAASGEEALAVARGHAGVIDLLVTDVVMPGIDGRTLADALQTDRPGLRVIYVSGHTDDAVLRRGVESAREAFVQKPFTPAALAERVWEVLDARSG